MFRTLKKVFRIASFFVMIAFSLLVLNSCNKKEGEITKKDDKSGQKNSDLVIKDDKGQKVNLKIVPKTGDKFRYKMSAKNSSKVNSPETGGQDYTNDQEMTYYYSQEVTDVNESGYITYKMKYDSIIVISRATLRDSTISVTFNTNIKDTANSSFETMMYNALAGQDFKFRLSPKGEIADVYELEKIHEKIFKALGDTLKADDKAKIKESMGSEALKSIIQNQFQKFPDKDIYKDSSWTLSSETNLSVYQVFVFPIKNLLTYKIKDIKIDKDDIIIVIDPLLGIEFIEKEYKEKGLSVKIIDSQAGGQGEVIFNLSKGCVQKKETKININLDLKLSAKGQTAKANETKTTNIIVELIP